MQYSLPRGGWWWFWVWLALGLPAWAWDYDGHRLVNRLALESLPTNFPAFVFTAEARERIAFLAGEPDRWRSTPELPLKHFNHPDHYFDFDLLPSYQIEPAALTPFRYEFLAQAALARAARPNDFSVVEPARDPDRSRNLIGLLPWAITEFEAKLKSGFSYLKEYEQAGTPDEIASAQANIIYIMGVMGHFVGDGSQPLHTTKHHHGWVGDNPEGYSTNYSIHAWIDGGYLQKFGVSAEQLGARLRPAQLLPLGQPANSPTNAFAVVLGYLETQFRQVEPLYRLEKASKLSGRHPLSQEGHDFITGQLLQAAQMLGDLWLTAWQQAPPDMTLRAALARRKLAAAPPPNQASPAFTNSLGMVFRWLDAGQFLMGTTRAEAEVLTRQVTAEWYRQSAPSEWPQRLVRISKSFHCGIHEVTVGQFRAFVEASGYRTDAERDGRGGAGKGPEQWVEQSPEFNWRNMGWERAENEPVLNVTWNDANAFCEWLSQKEGARYRLPTEAEWEYACRAGNSDPFFWGTDAARRKEFAWSSDNSDGRPHPVGQLRPNAWGLYDMLGNAYEYCADGWSTNIAVALGRPGVTEFTNPRVSAAGDDIVVRGTSWGTHPQHCRSAFRGSAGKTHRNQRDGFRVVREGP
jgi:formylglycine-generating enzyme required for sulfatase activity